MKINWIVVAGVLVGLIIAAAVGAIIYAFAGIAAFEIAHW